VVEPEVKDEVLALSIVGAGIKGVLMGEVGKDTGCPNYQIMR